MRNLADAFIQFLHSSVPIIREIEAADAAEVREPGRKTDHEPFFQIERLKQDSFHQLEAVTERFKDFDFRFAFRSCSIF